jgi:pimeloyl-ACP methyl ester carboxylesterase
VSVTEHQVRRVERRVRANGIEIHYVEMGAGDPLVLLHGGLVSTNPIWAGVPVSYHSHMETLAEHFRVIAPPDTLGCSSRTCQKRPRGSWSSRTRCDHCSS